MRITLIASGSHGDVLPYILLGRALHEAGYTVRVAVPENHREAVLQYGLDYAPLKGDFRQLLETEEGRATIESGQNPLTFIQNVRHLLDPILRQMTLDIWAACKDANAIVSHPVLVDFAAAIAQKQRSLLIRSTLTPPMTRTMPHVAFPDLFAAFGKWLREPYNRLTYDLMHRVVMLVLGPHVRYLRREVLNLPENHQESTPSAPLLFACSPQVVPPEADWPDDTYITGYWFAPEEDWTPPPALVEFLADGPPPVCIGFGSMSIHDPDWMTDVLVDALRRSGQRGLLQAGWAQLANSDLPESVFKVGYVPHRWLFPQMAAVVCHGGAGTTAAGMRAGVPVIVTPFIFVDQPFWGARVHALGVGPEPIPRKDLTAEKLAYAIRVAVTHAPMRRRAAALGAQLRAEDGTAAAVRIIRQHLGAFYGEPNS